MKLNVLAVGAHFDDIELGCGGTLIKHVLNGDSVTMLVVTNSAYSNPEGVEIRSKEIALEEGTKASAIIGADLICLKFDTFYVPYDETLTSKIRNVIEKREIEVIYTHSPNDIHRDHENTGKSVQMAGRYVSRFLMFRSNIYDTGKPFNGTFYSDISDVMGGKIKAIKMYHSELNRVNNKWLEYLNNQNLIDGEKVGVKYAECFRVVRYRV